MYLGGNYPGPVRHVLRQRGLGQQVRALDLGTGTGVWCVTSCFEIPQPLEQQMGIRVLDMARDFPHVRFDGLDIGERLFSFAEAVTYRTCSANSNALSPPERDLRDAQYKRALQVP